MVRVDFTLDGHSPTDGIGDVKKEPGQRKLALRVKHGKQILDEMNPCFVVSLEIKLPGYL